MARAIATLGLDSHRRIFIGPPSYPVSHGFPTDVGDTATARAVPQRSRTLRGAVRHGDSAAAARCGGGGMVELAGSVRECGGHVGGSHLQHGHTGPCQYGQAARAGSMYAACSRQHVCRRHCQAARRQHVCSRHCQAARRQHVCSRHYQAARRQKKHFEKRMLTAWSAAPSWL
jgi:hypothetical protein